MSDFLRIAKSAWCGEPSEFTPSLSTADAIIGFSFGAPSRDNFGLVNERIAVYLAEKYKSGIFDASTPVVLQEEVANALQALEASVSPLVVSGLPSSTIGTGAGISSYDVLLAAKELLGRQPYNNTALVGQKRHIGRVAYQYKKLFGHPPLVPNDLPEVYDSRNEQWWTRGSIPWAIREWPIATVALKARGEI